MTALDVPIATDQQWTLEWERAVLHRLADEIDFDLPEQSSPVRAPATDDEREHFYDYWTYVAALDLFIIEACAKGIGLAPDPEFRLFLTRQIADDGFHAQRFREQIEEVAGRDPLDDMVRHRDRQWDIFGDLASRSWEGFLAFEVHYELYVVPSMLVNGRKSTIGDARLVELAAERFMPDELYHRAWVADWWRHHLATVGPDRAEHSIGTLRELDDEGQRRRDADLRLHWQQARDATGADNHGIEQLYGRWRSTIQDHLYAPPS